MSSEEIILTAVPIVEEAEEVEEPVPEHDLHVKYVGWEGSNVRPIEIDWLYKTKRIPPQVSCRLPKGELEPIPEEGEVVVFVAHFTCGFGLPTSGFFVPF
jgi:hypothetical protein